MKGWRSPACDRQRSLFTRGHHFATLFQQFHRDLAFRGTYAHNDAAVYLPRCSFTLEQWKEQCEPSGHDPNSHDFTHLGAQIKTIPLRALPAWQPKYSPGR
jgi:hypothetical protein